MTAIRIARVLLLLGGVSLAPLHAGFVNTTCFVTMAECVGGSTYTGVEGTTTYTYGASATGTLVNGKPTIGTMASMTVDDPNGVPIPPTTRLSYGNVDFTDQVAAGPAPQYQFQFDLHVVNDPNPYFQGFVERDVELQFYIWGMDASDQQIWDWLFHPVTISTEGNVNQHVTFTTPIPFWNTTGTTSMRMQLILTSTIYYSNYFAHTTATHVSTFTDASQTLTFDSIEALDGIGNPVPMDFTSLSGANYSNSTATPEPASGLLALAGVAALGWRRRR
jgi:MYXO-CTERM domain-containing protein